MPYFFRRCHRSLLFPAILCLVAIIPARADGPFPPHTIVANVHYVGSNDLAIFLVTTPRGHMLINTGFEETVPLIQASVRSLGFKMKDIKIILASHAHSDHVAGHARARELSGAKVFVMQGDDGVIRDGGKGQYLYVNSRWQPCPVDKVLKHNEKVTLGGTTLVARHTPGHTRGCTTWSCRVKDGGKERDVVIIGSPNVNPGFQLVKNKDYPRISNDFATTFKVLKSLKCDVFLGAHGAYYGMLTKYPIFKKKTGKNPFIDPAGYRNYVELKEKAYLTTLAAQKKAVK